MSALTEAQQFILNMRKPTFFVNRLKEDYENLTQITVYGHNAIETKFDGKPTGWSVELFKVILMLDGQKKALTTSELWDLFKNRPQLKFGPNNRNRVIEKNSYIQINIGTKLNKKNLDGKEIEYYTTTGYSIKGRKEKDILNNLYDSFMRITSDKQFATMYSWYAEEEDTTNIEVVNVNELEGLCMDDA